jgi:hypothetical protein
MSKLELKYTFDTENEGDMYEYEILTKADQYRRLLSEIFQSLRSKVKHSDEVGSWEDAYSLIWELANDENLNPWEEIF